MEKSNETRGSDLLSICELKTVARTKDTLGSIFSKEATENSSRMLLLVISSDGQTQIRQTHDPTEPYKDQRFRTDSHFSVFIYNGDN